MDFGIWGWRFVLRSLEDLVGWYKTARILAGRLLNVQTLYSASGWVFCCCEFDPE